MQRVIKLGALAAGTAVILSAAPTKAQEGVELGMITSLTGTNAVQGEDIANGMNLALERINAGYDVPMKNDETRSIGPGLLGGDVSVIVEDTESRPQSAMDATRKLVNVDDVPVVLGEYSSGVSLPTGQFTNENGVIQISIGSTSPQLREIGPYFFNAIGLDAIGGAELAREAMEDSGATRYASIVPNNPFGIGLEISACGTIEELGGECINTVRYELEKTDYRPELNRLFQGDPEAIFYTAYGTEARLIFRQAYELGLEPEKGWYADYMTMWSNEMTEIPEAAEGVKGWVVGVEGDFYETEYADAYQEMFDREPMTAFGAYAYDAMMLAALAIDEAGSSDPDDIQEALMTVAENYLGVTGDKTFDEDGMQVAENYQYRIYTEGALQPYELGSTD